MVHFIFRTELKQAEEADSGLDSTDINIKLDLRRQKESKLTHLQSLSRYTFYAKSEKFEVEEI